MSSGIAVNPEIKPLVEEMKLRSSCKWLMFKMKDDLKEIIFEKKGEKCSTDCKEDDKQKFDELAGCLDAKEPRYIVYDFGFVSKEGRKINKLAFIFWCSDGANVKKKMVYASSKDAFKKEALQGVTIEFQANDPSDMDYDDLASEVEKKA